MTAPDERPVDGRFGMPTEGMAEAIADAGLPSSVWAVYCALCLFADRDTRTCKPSQGRLARNARLTERGVRNALALGVEHGLWTVKYRYKRARTATSKGEQTTSEYTVHDWDLAHLRPELTSGRPIGSSAGEPGGPELTSDPARNSLPTAPGSDFRPPPELTSDEQTSLARPLGSYLSSHTPSATADGHARGASDGPDPWSLDVGLADTPAIAGDSRSGELGSTPGQDEAAADVSATAPGSRPGRVVSGPPRIDRARLRRLRPGGERVRRIGALAVDALRAVGAESPPSVRGEVSAVVRLGESRGLDEAGLADAVDEALARLAGVEAAVS